MISPRQPSPPTLPTIDDVAVDKIFSFLSPQDLRALHQVSKACKIAVEKRPSVNAKRLQLVESIRENKENLHNNQEQVSSAERNGVYREGMKPGSLRLVDCLNRMNNTNSPMMTPSPSPSPSPSGNNNNTIAKPLQSSFVTPTSRFLLRSLVEDAGISLSKARRGTKEKISNSKKSLRRLAKL